MHVSSCAKYTSINLRQMCFASVFSRSGFALLTSLCNGILCVFCLLGEGKVRFFSAFCRRVVRDFSVRTRSSVSWCQETGGLLVLVFGAWGAGMLMASSDVSTQAHADLILRMGEDASQHPERLKVFSRKRIVVAALVTLECFSKMDVPCCLKGVVVRVA